MPRRAQARRRPAWPRLGPCGRPREQLPRAGESAHAIGGLEVSSGMRLTQAPHEHFVNLDPGFTKQLVGQQAADNAARNEKAAIGLYEGGRKTFDDVVKARLDAFERADELIQTQIEQASTTVQLYLALGGGW